MMLFTIGFTHKSLREFVTLLREARVDGVVDIRLRNNSQLAGFAKRDDLAFILETFGIGYCEEPRLAPTDAILDRYHRDHEWDAYVPAFEALLETRPLSEILAEIEQRFQRPCLLCAEPGPERCHRRLVAEAFVRLRPGLEVRHLVLPSAETEPAGKPAGDGRPTKRPARARAGARSKRGEGVAEEVGR